METLDSGEGGTNQFKFSWEIKENAKGKMQKTIKVRANSLEEAKGMLYDSEEAISEFVKKNERVEQ